MDEKSKTEKTVLIMACAIIGIGFSYLFLVTFYPIPTTGTDHAKTVVGFILGVGISTLLNFYWGSSKGSQAKSDTIDRAMNNNPIATMPIPPIPITEPVPKSAILADPTPPAPPK